MSRQIQSLYLCDPNLSIGMKGYYASTRPDSFLIRNSMGSGPGHSGWKWLPFKMRPSTSGTWKWGNKCAYLHRHRQSPWQIHTKRADDVDQTVEYHLQVKSPEFKPQYNQSKEKKKLGDKDIAQREWVCGIVVYPACARPWVQFPSIAKSKKKKKR
jgi:hypothetical protein